MSSRLLKIISISLMSLLSGGSFAESKILDNLPEDPNGFVYFDREEVKELAKYKVSCDRALLDRNTYREQFNKCVSGEPVEKTSAIIMWSVASFLAGFLVANSNSH